MGLILKPSPFSPDCFPHLHQIDGVRLYTAELNLTYQSRDDIFLAVFDQGAQGACVVTQSSTASAAVQWCQENFSQAAPLRAIFVNAGNSIAFTGQHGHHFVKTLTHRLGDLLESSVHEMIVASTGVIGQVLDPSSIDQALGDIILSDHASWEQCALAITTTDTYAKGSGRCVKIHGVEVSISGIAKGSGMIAPNMATLLGFVFTDACLSENLLSELLKRSVDKSFNAISVDGDTSTSDTVVLAASGAANHPEVMGIDDPALADFIQALDEVFLDLAHQVVKDGEGISKFITVHVQGAQSHHSAKIIARSICESSLVKTAIAGEDANWGRIIMAVGSCGQDIDQNKIDLWIGGILVANAGAVSDQYDEGQLDEHMKGRDIDIRVHLGQGLHETTMWTCDLTHDYIDINANYRS